MESAPKWSPTQSFGNRWIASDELANKRFDPSPTDPDEVPIDFAPIDKVFADPSDAGLSAKAANPNAAKVFIEYLCPPEGQRKVADAGEFVLAPGIFPALKGADKIVSNLLLLEDPNAEQLAKLQNEFRQLFLAK